MSSYEQKLLKFLSNPESYPHSCQHIVHRETHISHVLLTGPYAYKVKKPLKLDFLDFSSVQKREAACQHELERNLFYAPELYLDVVPIFFSGDDFSFEGSGNPVEWALKMKEFDEDLLFSRLLKQGRLEEGHIERFCYSIARIQKNAKERPECWGELEIERLCNENIESCRVRLEDEAEQGMLKEIATHTRMEIFKKSELLKRRQQTHVKLLHGDLHLSNICIFQGKEIAFDCIEFNDAYASCDSIADIAFLLMDLLKNKRQDLYQRALNSYLESSDDYEGLTLLPLYISYRAMVRAKVRAIKDSNDPEIHEYLKLARSAFSEKAAPFVVAIGGVSGSGKSTIARALAKKLKMLHLRSDFIRKSLLGIEPLETAPDTAYSSQMSEKTYEAMLQRAKLALEAGFPVILDATYIEDGRRSAIFQFAKSLGIPFYGFFCSLPDEMAHERIEKRTGDVSDADTSVLKRQLQHMGEISDWNILDVSTSLEKSVSEIERVLFPEL